MAGEVTITVVGNLTDDPVRVTEFWMHVDRRGPDDCWEWTGYTEDGYGRFYVDGRMIGAHEVALTFTTGERRLPELDTCHSCGNPPCCNPRHLRFDSRASNNAETKRMGRARRARQISDEQVRLIRQRRAVGAAQETLAEQYGISSAYVSLLVNGHARAEAGGPIAGQRRYVRRAN